MFLLLFASVLHIVDTAIPLLGPWLDRKSLSVLPITSEALNPSCSEAVELGTCPSHVPETFGNSVAMADS